MAEDFSYRRDGFAGVIFISLFYMVKLQKVQEIMKKKNIKFNLIIESSDFPPKVLISFKNKNIFVYGIPNQEIEQKIKYDAKLIADSETIVNYFLGNLGLLRPILVGKIKVINFIKLIKLIWYIKLCIKFYGTNIIYGINVYKKMKNFFSELRQ